MAYIWLDCEFGFGTMRLLVDSNDPKFIIHVLLYTTPTLDACLQVFSDGIPVKLTLTKHPSLDLASL
jgi:hypothetical protein